MRRRLALLTLAVLAAGAAPAGAVIGGTPVDAAAVPWFASVRRLRRYARGARSRPHRRSLRGEAGHARRTCAQASSWAPRGGSAVAHRHCTLGWRASQRRQPAPRTSRSWRSTSRCPASCRSRSAARIRARHASSATGWTAPPGTGEGGVTAAGCARRSCAPMSDDECAAAFLGERGNDGERFDARRMRCAIDADGLPPLSSGCNGDSGGPLYAGPATAPVLLGVVSWGGRRCGADRLPSVFADVARVRAFIADPTPTWAPVSTSLRGRTTGTARVGRTLTCRVSGPRPAGTEVRVSWHCESAAGRATSAVAGSIASPAPIAAASCSAGSRSPTTAGRPSRRRRPPRACAFRADGHRACRISPTRCSASRAWRTMSTIANASGKIPSSSRPTGSETSRDACAATSGPSCGRSSPVHSATSSCALRIRTEPGLNHP